MKESIIKIESSDYDGYVYNLEVDPNHETNDDQFYLDDETGIVIHNCHPRDNIALSWLAKNIDLSFDWYQNLMQCRENQTEWLSKLILEEHRHSNLEIIILGKTFKKETNLVVGSTSILLRNILEESNVGITMYDPWIDGGDPPIKNKALFFIGTNHDIFLDYKFPKGSIVIDPWRFINDQDGVKLIKVGNSK